MCNFSRSNLRRISALCAGHRRAIQKDFHNPGNHDDVNINLEPDLRECEAKWALGSNTTKLVEVMEFQLSYFKS